MLLFPIALGVIAILEIRAHSNHDHFLVQKERKFTVDRDRNRDGVCFSSQFV